MKRRNDKEIKMQIVDTCWARAEGKLVIAKKMGCNWGTIRKYAEELANEGILERVVISEMVGYKVKQIVKDVLFHQWDNKDIGLCFAFDGFKQQLKEIK